MPKVVVTLKKDGSVKEEVFGAKGEQCLKMTAWIEDALGTPERTSHKSSYFEEAEVWEVNELSSGHCG
jgi:hypothetical protein